MKTIKLFSVLFLVSGLTLISCTKDGVEGAQGEQGPQGVAGETGATGEQGEKGEAGDNGNTNVVASDWIKSEFPNENLASVNQEILDENLKGNVLNSAVILGYARIGDESDSGQIVYALPFNIGERNFFFNLEIGGIKFFGQRTGTQPQNFSIISAFRYIIIPQASSKSSPIDFKKMSYEEIIEHFGLKY